MNFGLTNWLKKKSKEHNKCHNIFSTPLFQIQWALVLYFVILFLSNATSTIFSQQILGGKLLLDFNWNNHFKLCIKRIKKLTEENCV